MSKLVALKTLKGLRWVGYFGAIIVFLVWWQQLSFSSVDTPRPEAITTDSAGNVYVADSGTARIEKFNSQGEHQASIGEGQFKNIYGPSLVAVDRQGNIYATQENDGFIRKFDAKGNFLLEWEAVQHNHFNEILSLATDSQNNVYVAVEDVPLIRKFDPTGQPQSDWTNAVMASRKLRSVSTLLIDDQDNLYVYDGQNLTTFNRQGEFVGQVEKFPGSGSKMIARDPQGNFIVGQYKREIQKLDSQGKLLASWNKLPDSVGLAGDNFDYYRELTVDGQGNIYAVHDPFSAPYSIEKLDSNGQLVKKWSVGLPRWLSPLSNALFPVGLILITLLFGVVPRPKRRPLDPIQEGLPAWINQTNAQPTTLSDHLSLSHPQRLGLNRTKAPGKSDPIYIALLVLGLVAFIAWMGINFTSLGDHSLQKSIVSALVLAVGIGFFVLSAHYDKNRVAVKAPNNFQVLILQALTTLPAKDRPVFVSRPPEVSGLRNYLAFYLPFNLPLYFMMSFSYITGSEDGWPAWVIQIVVVSGLVGTGLLCLWLFNLWQKPGVGLVKLTGAEMAELFGRFGLCVLVFDLLTLTLDNLTEALKDVGPHGLVGGSPSVLLFVVIFFKYGLLTVWLALIPQQWVNNRLHKGDYDSALRRVMYLRRWINTTSMRLFQVNILIQAGRLSEAEYLVHEGLVLLYEETEVQYWTVNRQLGGLLAGLGRVRMNQGQFAEAVFYLETALALQPARPGYLINLAEIYLRNALRPARALELLNYSTGSNGQWLFNWVERRTSRHIRELDRAWALAALGRQIEADNALTYVLNHADPKNKPGLAAYYRAACLRQIEDNQQAATHYLRQAHHLDPDGLYGQWAGQALHSLTGATA